MRTKPESKGDESPLRSLSWNRASTMNTCSQGVSNIEEMIITDHTHQRESGISGMSSLTLGLYAHWRKPGAANSLRSLYAALENAGVKALFEEKTAELLGLKGETLDALRDQVD